LLEKTSHDYVKSLMIRRKLFSDENLIAERIRKQGLAAASFRRKRFGSRRSPLARGKRSVFRPQQAILTGGKVQFFSPNILGGQVKKDTLPSQALTLKKYI